MQQAAIVLVANVNYVGLNTVERWCAHEGVCFVQAQSSSTGCLRRRHTDSACLPRVVLYPLDTIKTRLQTATSQKSMQAMWKSGGNKALYKGLMGNLAGSHSSPMLCT